MVTTLVTPLNYTFTLISIFYLQINGVDVSEADHAEVVNMLTGIERFVRLCVERHIATYTPPSPTQETTTTSAPTSASFPAEKSPKLFGLPKPYTGLKLHGNSSYISPSSYMANRPDYMRRREPGQYTRTSVSSINNSNSPTTPNTSVNTSGGSIGSYGKLPGLGGILTSDIGGKPSKSATLPGSRTLPELVTSNETTAAGRTSVSSVSSTLVPKEDSDKISSTSVPTTTVSRSDGHHQPDTTIKELISKLPPDPPAGGNTTETVKRTTYTETTVKRVVTNHNVASSTTKPIVIEVKRI